MSYLAELYYVISKEKVQVFFCGREEFTSFLFEQKGIYVREERLFVIVRIKEILRKSSHNLIIYKRILPVLCCLNC